ncbi:MAG: hypothetical protein RIG61_06800 [Deltaproteobacteria bacterium]
MHKSSQEKIRNDGEKESIFRRAWEGWKKIARKIGDFNARVILTIFYFILLMPFALLIKLFTDPLEIKKKARKGWHPREQKDDIPPLERAERQF